MDPTLLTVSSLALSSMTRSDARRQSPDSYDMRAAAAAVIMKKNCVPAVTRHACCMALIQRLVAQKRVPAAFVCLGFAVIMTQEKKENNKPKDKNSNTTAEQTRPA
jgi:hypothetical protein